jgi:hypothetical protein
LFKEFKEENGMIFAFQKNHLDNSVENNFEESESRVRKIFG